jgi:hypothetical protein
VRGGFGVGGFLADATAGAGVGCAAGSGAAAPGAAPRGVPVPGSGVMMLTGGVEAALGNSALVGLPVGIDDNSATGAVAVGAFHNGA